MPLRNFIIVPFEPGFCFAFSRQGFASCLFASTAGHSNAPPLRVVKWGPSQKNFEVSKLRARRHLLKLHVSAATCARRSVLLCSRRYRRGAKGRDQIEAVRELYFCDRLLTWVVAAFCSSEYGTTTACSGATVATSSFNRSKSSYKTTKPA